jgi:hypothetical protein
VTLSEGRSVLSGSVCSCFLYININPILSIDVSIIRSWNVNFISTSGHHTGLTAFCPANIRQHNSGLQYARIDKYIMINILQKKHLCSMSLLGHFQVCQAIILVSHRYSTTENHWMSMVQVVYTYLVSMRSSSNQSTIQRHQKLCRIECE